MDLFRISNIPGNFVDNDGAVPGVYPGRIIGWLYAAAWGLYTLRAMISRITNRGLQCGFFADLLHDLIFSYPSTTPNQLKRTLVHSPPV